jgi:folylpolyglutamate synthase/dihydrofolate synthase
VRVGVVEVGMGGKLDSTNILNNQVVSVIAKIGRDHEGFLGNTLEEIARHKAGILRPNVPYIVNPENEPNVRRVIDEYAKEIGAGPRLSGDTPTLREGLYSTSEWGYFASTLPPFQRDNAVMAIVAAREATKSLGETMVDKMIADELLKVRCKVIPGRLQKIKVIPVFGSVANVGREILVDGAHNVDAAIALAGYVEKYERKSYIASQPKRRDGWPVTWVLAMTKGKDAEGYLRTLLRPGDNVITTAFGPVDGMPWVKPMDPTELLNLAQSVVRDITGLAMPKSGTLRALCAARYLAESDLPIIMAGSLYLAGDFYRELQGKKRKEFWTHFRHIDERQIMKQVHKEEFERVNRFFRGENPELPGERDAPEPETAEQRKKRLSREIEALDLEMDLLDIEQLRISPPGNHRSNSSSSSAQDLPFPTRRATFPPPTPFPSKRIFPGRFKELRERSKRLRDNDKDNDDAATSNDKPASSNSSESEPEGETARPKIRMHFGNVRGEDRRQFWRPEFVKKEKWEA